LDVGRTSRQIMQQERSSKGACAHGSTATQSTAPTFYWSDAESLYNLVQDQWYLDILQKVDLVQIVHSEPSGKKQLWNHG